MVAQEAFHFRVFPQTETQMYNKDKEGTHWKSQIKNMYKHTKLMHYIHIIIIVTNIIWHYNNYSKWIPFTCRSLHNVLLEQQLSCEFLRETQFSGKRCNSGQLSLSSRLFWEETAPPARGVGQEGYVFCCGISCIIKLFNLVWLFIKLLLIIMLFTLLWCYFVLHFFINEPPINN